MADSADLVVLGAYFGTGAYGGMMSVFLMGCYDNDEDRWKVKKQLHLLLCLFLKLIMLVFFC